MRSAVRLLTAVNASNLDLVQLENSGYGRWRFAFVALRALLVGGVRRAKSNKRRCFTLECFRTSCDGRVKPVQPGFDSYEQVPRATRMNCFLNSLVGSEYRMPTFCMRRASSQYPL